MNVKDTKAPEVTGDRLQMIFDRQHELGERYEPIEAKNGTGRGLLQGRKWNIHAHHTQEVVKNFCWRVTEELMESKEAYNEGSALHCWEEIADAFHFLVELCILQGMEPRHVIKLGAGKMCKPRADDDELDHAFELAGFSLGPITTLNETFFQVIYCLGLACNCLKNKPWKQTQIKTDVSKFEHLVAQAFIWLISSARIAGMNADNLYDLYFRKSVVNDFRIRSAY